MANNFNQKIVILSLATIAIALAALSSQVEALEPIVDVGQSSLAADAKHVYVSLPGIYNLRVDSRGRHKGARITQSVLSGMVNIFIDRERQSDGTMRGPIQVKVFGQTMFDNHADTLSSSTDTSTTLPSLSTTS